MTLSISEQIMAALLTKLEGISAFPEVFVERNRDAPVKQFPSLILFDGEITQTLENTYRVENEMTVRLDGFCIGSPAESLGTQLHRLQAEANKALTADYTLDGLCEDVNHTQVTFDIGQGEGQGPVGFFSAVYVLKFATKEGNPFSLAP